LPDKAFGTQVDDDNPQSKSLYGFNSAKLLPVKGFSDLGETVVSQPALCHIPDIEG
jgi:hypothetical protein